MPRPSPSALSCEPLEGRAYCAKTQTALDLTYHFADDAITKVAGNTVDTFGAVAGLDGRTYVLAEYAPQGKDLLAVAAVRADGTLDPTYGTNGVALTGRRPPVVLPNELTEILRVDGAGRAYLADNTRVLRLKANGTTDKSFGDGGAVRFASADHGVSLGDLAPTHDGVLVATTSTKKGVERFAVQKIDAAGDVTTVWTAEHDTGDRTKNFDGNRFEEYYDEDFEDPTLSERALVFSRSRGGLVLAHVEDATHGAATGSRLNTVVVTTFDAEDHAKDISRTELRRNRRFGDTGPDLDSVRLSASGRSVTILTDIDGIDTLQIDTRTGKVHRYDKPVVFGEEVQQWYAMPDGYEYALGYGNLDTATGIFYKPIARFTADGMQDMTFGDYQGVATIRSSEFADKTESIEGLFSDASGRVYLYAPGGTEDHPLLALARL